MKPALFSANSEGACPNCNGAGVIYTDLAMMAGVATICEECEGKRFQASVLEYHFGGRDISEVLAMSVTEAEEFFGAGEARTPAAHTILERLADVGLGYLSLGQPLTTLSGGERQRLKLATHMGEKGGVYVLDEPTTGLHLADVEQLLGLLDRLVDSGKSVIVIEHHQAVMAHADWIIDLGPGAGHDGGRIVFEGTPADLVADRSTLTGEHLAAYVGRTRLSSYSHTSCRPSHLCRGPRGCAARQETDGRPSAPGRPSFLSAPSAGDVGRADEEERTAAQRDEGDRTGAVERAVGEDRVAEAEDDHHDGEVAVEDAPGPGPNGSRFRPRPRTTASASAIVAISAMRARVGPSGDMAKSVSSTLTSASPPTCASTRASATAPRMRCGPMRPVAASRGCSASAETASAAAAVETTSARARRRRWRSVRASASGTATTQRRGAPRAAPRTGGAGLSHRARA